jgi:glycosyltransferase involved in cell wall biosynthesis
LNQTRIAEAYAVADAVVVPSAAETWGLVVNEAMASGLPCIVSDRVGCGPDLVDRGRNGDVFPMGDVGALSALMVQYADTGRLNTMGRSAAESVESHSVQAAATALLQAVEMVQRLRQ